MSFIFVKHSELPCVEKCCVNKRSLPEHLVSPALCQGDRVHHGRAPPLLSLQPSPTLQRGNVSESLREAAPSQMLSWKQVQRSWNRGVFTWDKDNKQSAKRTRERLPGNISWNKKGYLEKSHLVFSWKTYFELYLTRIRLMSSLASLCPPYSPASFLMSSLLTC